MIMKHIIFILIIVIASSCSDKKKSDLLILDKSVSLKCIEYDNELIMPNPLSIELIDNSLYLFQPQGEDAALIVDKNNGKIKGTWGKRGNGPGEFTYPLFWGENPKEKQIYLYDMNRFILRSYTYHHLSNKSDLVIKNEVKLKPNTVALRYATVLDNGNIIASCIYNQESPLLLMNNNLDSINSFGDIPDKDHKSIDLRSYWGTLSSFQNKFVFAMAELGYIVCYEQNKNEIIKKWEHYLEKPIYKGNALNEKLLKRGFSNVKMTNNYIFCVYSGKKWDSPNMDVHPETILVFNHQGKLLKNFHLDRRIGKIVVSSDEKTIYAISLEPEISIIRYEIENYL